MTFGRAIILNLIFCSIAFKCDASPSSISGSDLSSLITKHLDTLGIESTPSINKNRVFSGCLREDIVIKKRDASWNTIQLLCRKNPFWNFNFRNKMDRPENTQKFGLRKLKNKKSAVKEMNVFVLIKNKSKGERIYDTDLVISAENKLLTLGAFGNSQSVIGRTLKRSLRKGTILKKKHLNPVWLVYKNQKVVIENNLGEISVKMEGIALKNGALGDRITARNTSSKKTVEGFVNGEKKISVFRKIY